MSFGGKKCVWGSEKGECLLIINCTSFVKAVNFYIQKI